MIAALTEHLPTILSFVLGGGLATGSSQLINALAASRKTRAEADKLGHAMSAETETITVATMKEAIQTMRDLAADANAARDRAETSERATATRLSGLEATNRDLCEKVARLEQDDRVKDRRISALETSLGQAKEVVARLVDHIRTHDTSTGPIPTVDYSIFDV